MIFVITAISVLCILFLWLAFRKNTPEAYKERRGTSHSSTPWYSDPFRLEDGKLREEFISASESGDKRKKKRAHKLELKNVPKPR